jgi:hypothetical protein
MGPTSAPLASPALGSEIVLCDFRGLTHLGSRYPRRGAPGILTPQSCTMSQMPSGYESHRGVVPGTGKSRRMILTISE